MSDEIYGSTSSRILMSNLEIDRLQKEYGQALENVAFGIFPDMETRQKVVDRLESRLKALFEERDELTESLNRVRRINRMIEEQKRQDYEQAI